MKLFLNIICTMTKTLFNSLPRSIFFVAYLTSSTMTCSLNFSPNKKTFTLGPTDKVTYFNEWTVNLNNKSCQRGLNPPNSWVDVSYLCCQLLSSLLTFQINNVKHAESQNHSVALQWRKSFKNAKHDLLLFLIIISTQLNIFVFN